MTPRLPSWPATLQAFVLVANLRLGLRQKSNGLLMTPKNNDKSKVLHVHIFWN
jgi:hypothetical protein